MRLKFAKAEAAGNDFALVDARNSPVSDLPALALAMSERHTGIGSDGLLVLEPANDAHALLRMFNADGTEDFCGNGLRLAASYLYERGEAENRRVALRTPKGRHEAQVQPLGNGRFIVDVQVVVPQFSPEAIPVRLPVERVLEYPLQIGNSMFRISCVSIGTAHCAIFNDAEVPEQVFLDASPLIERHAIFPERTSVLWCRPEGPDRIHMRIWERGVGETLSCGTGACAAAVIGRTLRRTGDRAEVITRGGRMTAEWPGQGPVLFAGPARIVYSGEWNPG